MKFLILLAILGLTSAYPKPTKLTLRNLYVDHSGEVKTLASSRIIGGHEATPHSIPFQAYLEIYSTTAGWACGGSLITPHYILTAAHCGYEAETAIIVLGAHKPTESEPTQVRMMSTNIKIHEKFNMDKVLNDVGVIKLPRSVTLTKSIQLVQLPKRSDVGNSFVGAKATVSGWGLTDGHSSQTSKALMVLETSIIKNSECKKFFGSVVTDSNVCISGASKTGSCQGDSGGPLISGGKQIGIVSYGSQYCSPGAPSAFARVTSFLDWIDKNSDVVIS